MTVDKHAADDLVLDWTCPECREGTLILKRGRFGSFAACSRYPDCQYTRADGPMPPDYSDPYYYCATSALRSRTR